LTKRGNDMHSTLLLRRGTAVLMAVGVAAAVVGCSTPAAEPSVPASDSEAAALLPQDVIDNGYITIVTDLTYPPFGFLDDDGSTPVGIDIDTGAALQEVLGIEVRMEGIAFDAFIPGLETSRYEAGLSAISDIPERRPVVDFIDFNNYGALILTQPDSDIEITEMLDLCGHSVGASKGSDTVITLEALQPECEADGREPVEIAVYGNQADSLVALSSGRIETVLGGSTAGYLADNSDGAYVVNGPLLPPFSLGGMAIPKDSPLTDALVAALTELYEDGTLAEIYAKYGIAEDALRLPEVNAAE
jgi:polar amino acid transport system substrate-binding protein